MKRKPPTFIHSLRLTTDLKEFLQSLENANKFVAELIKNSAEFESYLRAKEAQENANQPSLFAELESQ